MVQELKTPRLRLRRPMVSDAPLITACVNDPRIYEKVARIAPGQTVKVTTGWLESVARGEASDLDHVFAIDVRLFRRQPGFGPGAGEARLP